MSTRLFNVINDDLLKFIGTEVPIQSHINHLVTHAMGVATTAPKLHPVEITAEVQMMVALLKTIKDLNPNRFDLDGIISQYLTIPNYFIDKDKLKKPVYLYIEFPDEFNTFIRVKLLDKMDSGIIDSNYIKFRHMLAKIGRKVGIRLKLNPDRQYDAVYAHGALHCKIKFGALPKKKYEPLSQRRVKYIIRDVERELLNYFNLDKELEWDY